ncbi:MAG: hypothetical protein IJ278_02590 [Clostridia bacterium]|nr:hypothetical protein [Clostridia bacterium]
MAQENLAYKSKRNREAYIHDIRPVIEKKQAKDKRLGHLKVAVVIAFFIIGGISLILQNVQITEQSNKNNKLKAQYAELYSSNKKKEIEINQKIDLKTVEELAVASYNMNRARKEQVVYIDVKGQDYGVMAKNTSPEEEPTENFNVLTGLMTYLEE